MNIFEKASRLKLRFSTSAGTLSVEDLWDLPLTSKVNKANLNDMGIGFKRKLKAHEEESLVDPKPRTDAVLQLSFDLIKYIIDTKVAERDAAKKAADIKEKRQKIIDAIVAKEEEGLKGASMDDLKKQLAELGGMADEPAAA